MPIMAYRESLQSTHNTNIFLRLSLCFVSMSHHVCACVLLFETVSAVLLKVIFSNATFYFKVQMSTLERVFVEHILGVVMCGRLYQLSPRYHAATRKPIFVQILGRAFWLLFTMEVGFVEEKIFHLFIVY